MNGSLLLTKYFWSLMVLQLQFSQIRTEFSNYHIFCETFLWKHFSLMVTNQYFHMWSCFYFKWKLFLNASNTRKNQNFCWVTNHSFTFLLACDLFSTSFWKDLAKFCKNNWHTKEKYLFVICIWFSFISGSCKALRAIAVGCISLETLDSVTVYN